MTLQQLLSRVIKAIPRDIPPGYWGEDELIDILNEGQRELAVYSDITTEAEVELGSGECIVDLPDDILKLAEVYWGDSTSRKEIFPANTRKPLHDDDGIEDGGDPSKYFMYGKDAIKVSPVPTVDANIYFVYIPTPIDMEDDDDNPHFDGSDMVLISYAIYRIYLESDRDFTLRWNNYMNQLRSWRDSYNQNHQVPIIVAKKW